MILLCTNRYEYDTDHIVSQLNIFNAESGDPMGIINWFAVHPTSMNNTNRSINLFLEQTKVAKYTFDQEKVREFLL